jgi:hypothetical protein
MKKYINKKNILILIGLVLLLLLIVAARNSNKPLTDVQIVTKLSSLTTIPDINTDAPRIFKIDTKNPQQPFFKDAVEGDVAVLFLGAQKAYIYSPSRNSVINQGPITDTENKVKAIEKKVETDTTTASTSKRI